MLYQAGIGYNGYLGVIYDATALDQDDDGSNLQVLNKGFTGLKYPKCIEMMLDLKDGKEGVLSFKIADEDDQEAQQFVFSDQIDVNQQYQVAVALRGQRVHQVQLINL